MNEWIGGLVTLAGGLVLVGAMVWGWRGRARRQGDLPAPAAAPPPGGLGETVLDDVAGIYVSTVRGGDWLDRVLAHGLGTRSPAVLSAGAAGLWWRRAPARDIFVPAGDVLAVARTRGQAGKYTPEKGIVVVSWRNGEHSFDTAFRPRERHRAEEITTTLAGAFAAPQAGDAGSTADRGEAGDGPADGTDA